MSIPDPSTFIGKKCVIQLKKGRKRVVRKVITIDVNGVEVENPKGGTHVYAFSEIAMMNKSLKEVDD